MARQQKQQQQQGGLGKWMKFTAPQAEIFYEKPEGEMEPTSRTKHKMELNYINKMIDRISSDPNIPNYKKTPLINAYVTKLSQIDTDSIDSKINNAFAEDFILWLQGKSMYNVKAQQVKDANGPDPQGFLYKTPWGNKKLHGKSIDIYIRSLADSKMNLTNTLTKMRAAIPNDIYDAWLYYKYIVREAELNPEDFFLPDFNKWTNQPPNPNDPRSRPEGGAMPNDGYPDQSPDPEFSLEPARRNDGGAENRIFGEMNFGPNANNGGNENQEQRNANNNLNSADLQTINRIMEENTRRMVDAINSKCALVFFPNHD